MATPDKSDALARLKYAIANDSSCDLGTIDIRDPKADWSGRHIPAKDVRGQIIAASAKGSRFILNGARIEGTLELWDLKLVVPISLTSCWLDHGIAMDFATLAQVDLSRSQVSAGEKGLAISGRFLSLAGDLIASAAKVEGGCVLAGATINGSLVARDSEFTVHNDQDVDRDGRWSINLTNATLAGDIGLRGSTLVGGVALAGTHVKGQLSLIDASITASPKPGQRKKMDMSEYRAVWAQRCEIGEAVLGYPSDASHAATYAGTVWFVGAKVGGQVDFNRAEFKASDRQPEGKPALVLMSASVGERLHLNGAEFPVDREVDLRWCQVRSFEAGTASWRKGQYRIQGLRYTSIDRTGDAARTWIRDATDGHRPGPYLTLATAAAAEGQRGDELAARIRASSRAASPLERLLLGWVSYGYRPYLVAGPLLAFALIACWAVGDKSDWRTRLAPIVVDDKIVTADQCEEPAARCVHRLVYAVDSVLPIDLKQVSTWRPNRSGKGGELLFAVVIINDVVSWALAGVFVAAVSGVLKRT